MRKGDLRPPAVWKHVTDFSKKTRNLELFWVRFPMRDLIFIRQITRVVGANSQFATIHILLCWFFLRVTLVTAVRRSLLTTPHNARVLSVTYRIAEKRQTACIRFTQRPKISIFATQGRHVSPIHVKFGVAKRTWVCLAVLNFIPMGVGRRNPNIKNFPFFSEDSLRRGEPLDRIAEMLRDSMRPTIPQKCFKFDVILFTG